MAMKDELSRLFHHFDQGKISRRRLLQALGVAVAGSPLAAFGQGRCGGARAGTPECNTASFPPPFEPTGWKTVLLDHFSLHVVDLEKEAAFYNALMGWNVRSNDGKTIVMDMGKVGGVIMRGGLVPADTTPARSGGGNRGPVKALWDGFCF